MINSFTTQYITEMVKNICIETGHVCPHWINGDIYNVLLEFDTKQGTDLANKYRKQCHEPEFIIRPATSPYNYPIYGLRCRSLDNNSSHTCTYFNLKAVQEMERLLIESEKAFAKEIDAEKL